MEIVIDVRRNGTALEYSIAPPSSRSSVLAVSSRERCRHTARPRFLPAASCSWHDGSGELAPAPEDRANGGSGVIGSQERSDGDNGCIDWIRCSPWAPLLRFGIR